jgi:hypothetical protein
VSDALLENVRSLVDEMRGLARQAHAGYAAEVEAVITARSRDAQRIERLLDRILDFGFDDTMVQLFKRLCRYYYTLDPAATASYVHTYREMWDSEGDAAGGSTVKERVKYATKKRTGRKPDGRVSA